jgi:Fe-S cluster assembly protein SufD
MSDPTTTAPERPDELRQEHAVDHAAAAPAPVTLDSSASAGPGGDAPAAPRAHGHGAGVVPDSSRGDRPTSTDPEDFAVPTGREEEWRFTPVDAITGLFAPERGDGARVDVRLPEGVTRRDAAADDPVRGAVARPGDRVAAAAFAAAGGAVVVEVPADAQVADPVRIDVHGTGGRATEHLVVRAGRFSRSVVVVDHTGTGSHAGLLEADVADGADLTVVSLQRWDDSAVHVAQHDARVGRDARFKHVAVSLGGGVVRLSTNVRYAGPGGDAELLGVYFADAGQHLEHRTFADHDAPHCRSNVTYKGALQGETARTVWIGDVLIRAAAEGTSTYELNRNLVLTDGARADSVPNLEIETGEIEGAGHASATGRFDDEQLFYLRARGIPEDVARRLVVRGFFADIIAQIGVPEVVEALMAAIDAELEQVEPALAGSPT